MKPTPLSKRLSAWFIISLLLCFIFQLSTASPDSYSGFRLEKGKYQTSFRFEMANNLIILPVLIEEQRLNLIFDTGMNSILVFNKRNIQNWKCFEKHTIQFSGLGIGNLIKGYRLDGLSVKMPSVNGSGISLVVTQSSPFPKEIGGIKVDGVFGYQLLARFIVQIDYKNQLITLIEPDYYVSPFNASVLDLNIYNTKPYISCPVVIDQKEYTLNLLVDTGAEAPLILNSNSILMVKPKGRSRVIGRGLAGPFMGQKIMVNNLVLGKHQLAKDFEAWVPNNRSYPNESPKLIRDGTLGGETLKQFVVTFDYFNNKIYLQTNS